MRRGGRLGGFLGVSYWIQRCIATDTLIAAVGLYGAAVGLGGRRRPIPGLRGCETPPPGAVGAGCISAAPYGVRVG